MADANERSGLVGTDERLSIGHDLLLVDLDGVVYLDDQPIEHAAAALAEARDEGLAVAFVTNNAARTPEAVAERLAGMGVHVTTDEVTTSAMAAAGVLADQLPAGSPVLVVGGRGVSEALRRAGLRPVEQASDQPAAVVQGWSEEVGWRMLAEAMVALRAGARWVATNLDATLPSPRGPLPGNGSLVAALATATGLHPEAVGKPSRVLLDVAINRTAATRPLVVGDRLDTDIEGARAAALPSLLVLTGVSQPADLLAAPPQQRPSYIGRDLRALHVVQPRAAWRGNDVRVGDAEAAASSDGISVNHSGKHGTADGLDGLRALCALVWSKRVPASMALQALEQLNLD